MPEHRIETHAHTNTVSACGRLTPEELVRLYVQAGYSALIVTDHLTHRVPLFEATNTWEEKVHLYFSGYEETRAAGETCGLVVLPGLELTFESLPGRDFLIYGIDQPLLMDLPEIASGDPPDTFSAIRSRGALVVQAHPFRYSQPIEASELDGVEVHNANPRHNSQNERAVAFAAQHALLALSGSDTHQAEDVGRGGVVTHELPTTIHEFVSLVRDRAFELLQSAR